MKTVTVAIAELKANLFVRQALNPDHVLVLAGYAENGVKLPPIKITPDRAVVDGRHRIAAYQLLDRDQVEAEVVEVDSEAELIAMAYKANVGGSLPPSSKDTEHTVMLLLEHKETMKRIGELLGLPSGLARRYVKEVQTRAASAKMQRAVSAVTDDGLTVVKAAELHEVDPEKLKERLSGHRRAQRSDIPEIQRGLTRTFRSLGARNATLLRNLLERHVDGEVSERQVREIFTHFRRLQKQSGRTLDDWMSRFEANVRAAKAEKKTA